MRGKSYKSAKEKAPTEAVDVSAAIKWLQEHKRAKFDETIELHVHLGIEPGKSDQMVRGTVQLPAGSVKERKIVILKDDKASEEILKQIEKDGGITADVIVATPTMMPKIAKVARILGPKGLMPNPKTGTVSPNPEAVAKELAGGKLSFKMDQLGNIHEAVGKVSWEAEKVAANINALLEVVRAARPAAAKGTFVQSVTLKSTMSPAVRLSGK